MPFDFLKRKKPAETGEAAAAAAPAAATPAGGGFPFEGMTEDWRLVGRMAIDGRLSDVLNKRDPIPIDDVTWAPADSSDPLAPAPGLRSIDPYDLVIVLASDESQPDRTSDQTSAYRVHKVSYEVALEAPPYRVIGTVFLYPGSEPDTLLQRSSDMFVAVVDAQASIGGRQVGSGTYPTILVNRQYLRGVEQVDLRTGERHVKLPGQSLGGTNWSDRAR
ncbi:MAG TPA: hypothetical protein VFV29_08225 [Actinomycetota bacterium]|nr:hypothetical protein [Actinomycetota bacterium]